ncbi:MAG TPA: DUF4302 domain-containing protein [Prevotella sp.]|jgi:hypothetical protein|nr:DUF4302 domain-containing protein [Prevotella sp.]HRN21866.1 DUF4302 domain-containing protein [Prevotella sp.]
MKRIYNILFTLIAILSFTSCSNDIDEVFDKPSAERVNDAIAEYKTVLTSAENGWLMKYYPKANTKYGGYNLLLKFGTDGNVTAMSDALGADTKATSHYKLEQSASIVLSFDEYNKVIHFFSDPANPAGIGDNGKGMEGDLEFRVLTATADSVVMLGKKRGAKIVMTPMAKDADWAETINQIDGLEQEMQFPRYTCEVNDVKYVATSSYRTITFTSSNAEDGSTTIPYIVTDKGIEFYKPITLNGVTIKGFNYVGGDNYEFDATSGSAKMYGIIPPLTSQLQNGNWFFSVKNMGTYGQAYWNKCYEICQGEEVGGEEMSYAFFGTSSFSSSNGKYGFVFVSANKYAGCLNCTATPVDDTHITLKFALSGDSNGIFYYNSGGYKYIIAALTAGSKGKTYSIEGNDLKSPTVLKLVDVDNPDNYYILSKNTVLYPYR